MQSQYFTCIGRGHGAPAVPATREQWEAMRREPWLKQMCRRIENGDEALKSRLPIWTPSCAEFRGNHRAVKDALKPLPRLMLDFDQKGHSEEILAKAMQLMEQGKWDILLVEESVRRGTHVLITLPQGMTLQEAQQRFSADVGFQADPALKDVARCIYMVPEENVLFLSNSLFEERESAQTENGNLRVSESNQTCLNCRAEADSTESKRKTENSEYSETSDDKHSPFRFPFSVFRSPIRFIQRCPVCGTPLVRGEEEASHYCPNDLHCAPQIIGRLEHFVSRKTMNISQVGPELIQQYYRNGMLHDVSDFYRITHDKKVADSVARSTEVPFERVLFALGIRFVGEIAAKTLARKFKDIDSLMSATMEQLLETDGIGNVIAESIINYFASEENRALIERLRLAGLQFTLSEEQLSTHSTTLQGQSIVISGVFVHHSRDEYKRIIEQHGGKNVGSISGKTSFILAGENMGPSKLEKAEKLGVRIVSEDEFLAMIGQE